MRPGTTLCLYNTMVSSHQSHTWEQGPLYLSIQHHGLFSPILLDWWEETMMFYKQIEWSLVSCMGLVRRDHDVVWTDIMVTGLMYGIETPWSLLTNHIHENRDHSICLFNTMVSSHQFHSWDQEPLYPCMEWDWWEEIMMLHRQIEWSMVSWIELVRRDHGVV
jgi:hypothetical protein